MKMLVPFLLSSLALTGCNEDTRSRTLVYRALFPNLACCQVDNLRDAPKDLAFGRSDVGELAYRWNPRSGKLEFMAPMEIVAETSPSIGAFNTRGAYGPQSSFTIIATFQNPVGPHLAAIPGRETNAWAVGLSARNGFENDYAGLLRFTATLKIRNSIDRPDTPTAYLNVQGIKPKKDQVEIDAEMYKWIFGDKYPFMMTLHFDRAAGNGFARLTAGNTITIPFSDAELAIPDTESISAVGATLANCCSPGNYTSVELRDFQIWRD